MSRITRVTLGPVERADLLAALELLSIAFTVEPNGEQLSLQGGLECAPVPVDVAVAAGPYGTIEAFGFALAGDGVELVCGDADRGLLERELVSVLVEAARAQSLARLALAEGLLADVELDTSGKARVTVRGR